MTPPFLSSPILPVPHGFFGRDGGVSEGHLATLNCGLGASDTPEHLAENRRRVQQALGAHHLYTGYQTHSAIARYLSAVPDGRLEADAFITDQPGLAVSVLTADCVPVLFHAPGWVGAAHAGWRGSLGGVLEATVTLFEAHGIRPETLSCAIGPALRSPLFEVGSDLMDAVTDLFPAAARFFTARSEKKWDYDHIGFVRWRLVESGIGEERISDVSGNTLEKPERWFSYRAGMQAGHGGYGRNIAAIVLPQG